MNKVIYFVSKGVLGISVFGLAIFVWSFFSSEVKAHFTTNTSIVSMTNASCTSVTVTWNRATPVGSITSQTLAGHYNDGTTNWQVQISGLSSSTTSYTVTGLTTGVQYWWWVGNGHTDGHYLWGTQGGPITVQCPVVYSAFYPAFYPSFYPGFYPSFYPSAYSAFYPAFYPSFYPGFYPGFYPSFSPCVVTNPAAPVLTSPASGATGQALSVNLDWNATSSWGNECGGVSGRRYRVYYGAGALANPPLVATVNDPTTIYNAAGLSPNTLYSWRVGAVNGANREAQSSVIQFTTAAVPGAFTLSATTFSQTAVDLSWTASSNAVTYELRRNGVLIQTQPAGNPRTFRDSGLTCNTAYNYQARAINAAGNTNSNTAIGVTAICSPGPFTLTATPVSQTQVNLSWTASANASNYQIYRGGVLVSTVGSATLSYNDTGRTCGTAYSYQISATNASTPPVTNSNVANATTSACTPNYPGVVTLNSVTEVCVNDSPAYDIVWSDTIAAPDAPATNYIIEVTKVSTGQVYSRTVAGGVFSISWSTLNQFALTPPGTTFNYAPEPSTNYSFRVTGVKTGFLNGVSGSLADTSSASCSSCAVTPPIAFSNLAPANGTVAPYRPDFSWTNAWPSGNSGASSYTLKLTPQGESQLPDVVTTNTYLTWAQVFAVWSGNPYLAGNDFLPVGVVYTWNVVADNQCTGNQTSSSTTFTSQNLSAWLQAVGGTVESTDEIELDYARPAGLYNSTYTVISGGNNNNFNSSSGWVSESYANAVSPETYSSLKNLFVSRAVSTASIMPNNGIYSISGDQSVNLGFSVPNEPTVLIVEGDLNINTNINLPNESDNNAALILIVDGDVNVDSSVTQIDAYLVVGGSFNSRTGASASSFSSQLNIFGGLVYFTGANFNRIIDPVLNPGNNTPAERFTYDPRIVYLFSGENSLGVSRTSWQELVP